MDQGLKKFTAHKAKAPFSNAAERQKAYRQVFGNEVGSKVLQDILSTSGWYRSFIPKGTNPDNASQSLFDQGKKYVCYEILNLMTIQLNESDMVAGLDDYDEQPLNLEEY